jgi:adenosylcobyric acid synthase
MTAKGLMICGTTSDAGKSTVTTGLCRLLARRGMKVAPFKAQNMALNSFVTPSGHEIGRAQGVQALAAGVEPEVAMNPILLKPTGERTSQVVIMGRPWAHLDAAAYHRAKPDLFRTVLDTLEDLRRRFDVVICEGAGSPAEINLMDHDVVNLRLASAADPKLNALIVGDIDRGGVFASLYGTVALLPDDQRALVKGFIINKLRGDPALLPPGPQQLHDRTGIPTLGVLPYLSDVALDAEDSLALSGRRPRPLQQPPPDMDTLDVVAIRLPRISNFTDLDALAIEPGVTVRLTEDRGAIGDPDLLIIPGTKATVADLEWLRGRGLDQAIISASTASSTPTTVLGICGGYQMLGRTITDPVEAGRPETELIQGLGVLDVHTVFAPDKITRQRRGRTDTHRVTGYQIHHGRTTPSDPWIMLDDAYSAEPEPEGARAQDGQIRGTTLHGLFEEDGFRAAFLADVAQRRHKTWKPSTVSFAKAREAQFDRLADMLEAHLDMNAVEALIR